MPDGSVPPIAVDLVCAALGIVDSLSENLIRDVEPRVVAAGTVLFRAGEPADEMYVVMSGELVVEKSGVLNLGPNPSVHVRSGKTRAARRTETCLNRILTSTHWDRN